MNYIGFLCLGLGLLSLVAGMIGGLLGFASHEPAVKAKAKRFATLLLPMAMLLLTLGFGLTQPILFPSE